MADSKTTLGPTDAIIEAHDRYLSPNYGRFPVAMIRGEGCKLIDAEGREYVDLFAGFGGPILGHCHPALVAAVTEQAGKLWHVGNLFHTEPQVRLAKAIAEHGFGGQSFFCHSGSDANEAAFKLARLYGKGERFRIISATQSFHGRGFAAMMATGQPKVREGFDPLLPGFEHVPFNDLDAVAGAIDEQTVAVIVEPIQGEGGVIVPDDDYLPGLRRLCDERDLLLICDEVWTGCGRTGKYFAHQHWHIEPDMMTLAKGVGGGLPVGVMCAKPEIAEFFDPKKQGGVKHATTLGGNCLAMAVSAAIFETIERDNLLEHCNAMGALTCERFSRLVDKNDGVRAVRGMGLFIGIELDCDSDNTWFGSASEVVNRCMAQGVLINATQNAVIRLAPPLTISRDELMVGLDVVEAVICG